MRYSFYALLLSLLVLAGCASTGPKFQAIDLGSDLDAATLARYKAEAAQAGPSAMKHSESGCHTVLEKTDGRLLGFLIYWHGGSVHSMAVAQDSPVFMVSEIKGWGPLSGLFVSQTMATYADDGRRLSSMNSSAILWGHLAMFHKMDIRVNGNNWHSHWMAHLVHHILGISVMDGKTSLALFSMPNPLMVGD